MPIVKDKEKKAKRDRAEYMREYYKSRPGYNAWKQHCQTLKKHGLPLPSYDKYIAWQRKAPKDSLGRVSRAYVLNYIQELSNK